MAADAQIFQPHALRIKHPEQVMIGLQQQLGGIAEGRIGGKPFRVGMPVRADDRQVRNLAIERAGNGAYGRVGREEPVGIEMEWLWHLCDLTWRPPGGNRLPDCRAHSVMVTGVKDGIRTGFRSDQPRRQTEFSNDRMR